MGAYGNCRLRRRRCHPAFFLYLFILACDLCRSWRRTFCPVLRDAIRHFLCIILSPHLPAAYQQPASTPSGKKRRRRRRWKQHRGVMRTSFSHPLRPGGWVAGMRGSLCVPPLSLSPPAYDSNQCQNLSRDPPGAGQESVLYHPRTGCDVAMHPTIWRIHSPRPYHTGETVLRITCGKKQVGEVESTMSASTSTDRFHRTDLPSPPMV